MNSGIFIVLQLIWNGGSDDDDDDKDMFCSSIYQNNVHIH